MMLILNTLTSTVKEVITFETTTTAPKLPAIKIMAPKTAHNIPMTLTTVQKITRCIRILITLSLGRMAELTLR